ncbi:MAG TPA: YraN family protein [Solirubrobacteraceae bacterium]|nr:YraN family protein [Solirubrobacteraceae bacterium]
MPSRRPSRAPNTPAGSPRDSSGGSPDGRRALGSLGEDLALAHLRALGFQLVTRNHRTRHGEIDLIVFDGHTLVFVEVKTRRRSVAVSQRSSAFGDPLVGLRAGQRRRLRKLATAWLAETRPRPRANEVRFDAIGVIVDRSGKLVSLNHLEGAW